MKVSSAKAKGRRHQQYVCRKLVETGYDLESDDIRSASMGAPGEDVLFSPAARKQFPFSIECKNVEKLSIWSAIAQARDNCPEGSTEMVVFTRNHETPQVSLPFEKFLEIYKVYLRMKDMYEDMNVQEDR